MTERVVVILALVLGTFVVCSMGFVLPMNNNNNFQRGRIGADYDPIKKIMTSASITRNLSQLSETTISSTTALFLDKKWFSSNDNEDDEDGLVTREMLLRDMLQDPTVKRKRKGGNGGYKPLDNRDHLPFAVKKVTPDPYTHPQIKKANQKRVKSKKTDLEHLLTPSRLYENKNGKTSSSSSSSLSSSTLLGEFKLDKSTTSGDIIQIGDKEYRVESARCQYKYAGGQRFVMVRKILEVKEVARALKEELLMKQFHGSNTYGDDDDTLFNATDVDLSNLD